MPRPPTPLGLQAFRQTILSGSATEAAAALGRTQPAISRLLKDLETDVGFALFDRVKGRLIPTLEGRLFFDELQRSFMGFERIATVAAEIRQGRRGTLRVAAMPSVAASFLPRALANFAQTSPETALELLIYSSPQIARMVQAQECDLGIIEGLFVPPALSVLRRHALRGAVLAPRGSPLACKREVTPRDLHGQPFVALSPARSSLGGQLAALMLREGIEPRITVQTHLTAAVSAFVLQGMGVGVADEQTALMHIEHGGVARPFNAPIAMQIHLVRAIGLPPAGALRSLIAQCDEAVTAHKLS
ncbi:LysR substrate-binding domain-containing protein [Plastoroseomonas hellenica]|uniref:LysR substrate-binding domain-containing protein n=1 Tax=Plastoroseomonas hellenica TaxID=2687306 RepID=UPI001BA4F4AA|nr:LysR substrate-binding domain-containing protein [Plastoroseomonas hellenica]MBR0647265.1 LysR family transcriptional regulator [Plastoroseomonas hellenica]